MPVPCHPRVLNVVAQSTVATMATTTTVRPKIYTPKDVGDDVRFQEGVTCEILRLTEALGIVLASRLFAAPGMAAEPMQQPRRVA